MAETIQTMHGSQTFHHASNKVNVFLMDGDGTSGRSFPNSKLKSIAKSRTTPAAKDGYDLHGMWQTNVYEAVDAKVLMVQASTSHRGAPYNQGCVLIALREDAPLIKVTVELSPSQNALYPDLPSFVGRGDVLSTYDFDEYGIRFRESFLDNFFDEEELEELFRVERMAPGTSKPDMLTVQTPEGGTTRVPGDTTSRRRVRIRSRKRR